MLELLEVAVEVVEDVVLDRGAGVSELLPVGGLGDQAGAALADRGGGLADVAAEGRCLSAAPGLTSERARPPSSPGATGAEAFPRGGCWPVDLLERRFG